MRKLEISEELYKAKIEGIADFDKSYLFECYEKAGKALVGIIQGNKIKEKNELSEIEDNNNIIAFSGERGTGKTSCMISFRNSLEKIENVYESSLMKEVYQKYDITNNIFTLLDVVDPSMFSYKDSIIEIIVGKMFEKFKKSKHMDDYLLKQNMIRCFDEVFKNLRILNAEKNNIFEKNTDNIEVLMDLASAVSLKENMRNLVDTFLKYISGNDLNKNQSNCNSGNKGYLVISIDDLDMNIQAGEKMLEEIRKYLILPNVIILMAIKIEQIEQVVRQRHVSQLNELSQYYKMLDNVSEKNNLLINHNMELINKTQKYLEKIIPYNHRIDMPYLWDGNTAMNISINEVSKDNNINTIIKELFRDKIGYWIATDRHLKAILPGNLRGLINLLFILTNGKSSESIFRNMRDYYYDVIIEGLEDYNKRSILKDILDIDISILNKKVLLYLNDLLYKKYDVANQEQEKIKLTGIVSYISEIKTNNFLIKDHAVSMGDIISWLKMYEIAEKNHEEIKFYELLKLCYSFRMIGFFNKFDNSSADLRKDVGRSILNDMIGNYFYITNNGNKDNLKVSFSLTNSTNRLNLNKSTSDNNSSIYDNIYFPSQILTNSKYKIEDESKFKEAKYIIGKDIKEKSIEQNQSIEKKSIESSLSNRKTIEDKDELGKIFYSYLQPKLPSYGRDFGKFYERDNGKPIEYYSYFYYEPMRVLLRNSTLCKFNNKMNSPQFFQINCDAYMDFLDEFDIQFNKQTDLKKYEPGKILNTIIPYLNNIYNKKYGDSIINLTEGEYAFIGYNIYMKKVVEKSKEVKDQLIKSIEMFSDLYKTFTEFIDCVKKDNLKDKDLNYKYNGLRGWINTKTKDYKFITFEFDGSKVEFDKDFDKIKPLLKTYREIKAQEIDKDKIQIRIIDNIEKIIKIIDNDLYVANQMIQSFDDEAQEGDK